MSVHVAVCIKQVLDPEIPPDVFRVDRTRLRADAPGVPLVMSIFDANALEVALTLREAAGGGQDRDGLVGGPAVR